MKLKLILITLLLNFTLVSGAEKTVDKNTIHKNLRCLVCQGQSIADSNSDFASTIKLVVQDQIKEGKTKEEIYDFLISKYGEWIVYKPTFTKNNFLLWVLPYLALAFGGFIVFLIVRKNKHNRAN